MTESSTSPRDRVLGLVHGYDAAATDPFFRSLHQVAPKAEVTLACSELSSETVASFRERGYELLPYRYARARIRGREIWAGNSRWAMLHRNYARWINAVPGLSSKSSRRWRARIVRHFLDPNTRRFVEFYLRSAPHLSPDDRILLSDIRDVVFQTNPFELIPRDGVVFSLEDDSETIGSQWANSTWLEKVGGLTAVRQFGHHRISCVGVVLGMGAQIVEYLGRLVDALTKPGVNIANYHGADTGAHNLVVYGTEWRNVRFADHITGGIVNLHGLPAARLRWTADGMLAAPSGEPFAVVHQYDRDPQLASRLLSSLGLNSPCGCSKS